MADFQGRRYRAPVERYECSVIGRRMSYFTDLVPRFANFASWHKDSRSLERDMEVEDVRV
jgi:hypothetical protein